MESPAGTLPVHPAIGLPPCSHECHRLQLEVGEEVQENLELRVILKSRIELPKKGVHTDPLWLPLPLPRPKLARTESQGRAFPGTVRTKSFASFG